MDIDKKKIKIEIFNEQYCLISDEKKDDLLYASEIVNTFMKEIADKSSLKDEKKIAVLAALRIANKLVSLKHSLQYCESRQKELAEIIDEKGLSSSF